MTRVQRMIQAVKAGSIPTAPLGSHVAAIRPDGGLCLSRNDQSVLELDSMEARLLAEYLHRNYVE